VTRDDLKPIMVEAVREALATHRCFCNLSGEGISPATHVEHHREWGELKQSIGKVKVGVVLAICTLITTSGLGVLWLGLKYTFGVAK
jgi:hypothetical protein